MWWRPAYSGLGSGINSFASGGVFQLVAKEDPQVTLGFRRFPSGWSPFLRWLHSEDKRIPRAHVLGSGSTYLHTSTSPFPSE